MFWLVEVSRQLLGKYKADLLPRRGRAETVAMESARANKKEGGGVCVGGHPFITFANFWDFGPPPPLFAFLATYQ